MLGHHYCGVKFVTLAVVVETVLENSVAGLRRERVTIVLAEGDEEAATGRLVVRQRAAVFIHPLQGDVGRTLLSAGVGFDFHSDIRA